MMRVSNLKGVAAYKVNEDDEVAWLDLQATGLRAVSARGNFENYFLKLREVVQEIGVFKGYEFLKEFTLRYQPRRKQGQSPLVFAVLAYRGRRVVGIVLGSTRSGMLKSLDKKLSALGWQRVFFMEMKPLSRRALHLGTRSKGSGF